jgi:hypothetical protein
MGYITLIKYAVIIAVIGSIVIAIHHNGRQIERAEWLEKDRDEKKRMRIGVNQIINHVRNEERAEHINTMRSLDERENEIEKLNNDYNALLDSNKRLQFKASAASCSKPLPGKAENTGLPAGEVTIELPAKIERGLRSIGKDVEIELINCNTLRDIVRPLVDAATGINDAVKK